MRALSLAAATAPASDRVDTIADAAAAGFDAVGLRLDLEPPSKRELATLQRRLDQCGIGVLDIEVVRIGHEVPGSTEALVAAGAELGARHILAVSHVPDRAATAARLHDLAELAAGADIDVVLEFMAFSEVRDLDAALAVVEAADHPGCGVLVDALHLARSGGTPADAAATAPLIPYLQLCDAPLAGETDVAGLADEARHHRRAPGEGELPLAELVAAVPDVPLSIEAPSDEATATTTSASLARAMYRAAIPFARSSGVGDRGPAAR